ncbi:MAG: alkyl sulfatase dimerization domain-containing protein, partial [Deltaproteobacteria bacterium]|nr:alkyl sulfatase dimerization domain-containing protein [Deltaproteobacteria bacterium]
RPTAFDIAPATTVRHAAVNDFIHLSEGTTNSTLIVTPAGRIIVNSGLGFEAPVHKAYFDSVDRSPVRYIILTQGHVDHVGGVDVLRDADTEIVAHAQNPAQPADDLRVQPVRARRAYVAWAAALDGKRGTGSAPPPVQSRPQPTILVRDRFAFTLGGLDVEVIACTGAETPDSLLVWLPQHRTLITSNIFSALFGHFPNLVTIRGDRYRDPLPYLATLELVRDLGAELLVVGHGPPLRGADVIAAELTRMHGAVQYVHDAVVAAMNGGQDVWTAMREIRLPPQLEQGEGYGTVAWSVRAIWEMYAGWFHHESTTELYPAPPRSVYAELAALAGGAGPLAAAAQRKAASAPLDAIHLAEVALAADPAHRGALSACRDAHRALLAGASNFWEVRWLEHRIRQLERALDEAP